MVGGFDVRFFLPSNMLAVGPTSSGKTSWLKRLVENRQIMFAEVPKYMILFYKEWQKAYEDMEQRMNQDQNENRFFKFASIPSTVEEMKDILEMLPKKAPKLVVFDDYLDEVGSVLKHFFTVLTHHYYCFTIFLCQNLFNAKNELRTLSINTQYMVLFNNPRDQSSISQLSKQVFPGKNFLLNEAYHLATNNRPYGYLLLDFHQRQNNLVRLRSHIFPHEYPMKTYHVSM